VPRSGASRLLAGESGSPRKSIQTMPLGDLSREELMALVQRIMRVETADEEEEDRLIQLFEDSVAYPVASNLIFYPREHFGEDYRHKTPRPEQVVDAALAYKPIQLGPRE